MLQLSNSGRQGQSYLCKFEANLLCIMNFRPAKITQEPVLRNKFNNQYKIDKPSY